MKLTLDEESIVQALFFWAEEKFKFSDGEFVEKVLISRDENGEVEATIVISHTL